MLGSESHTNPATLNAYNGSGYVTNIGGLPSYVTGSPHSMVTILLITDIFGINATIFRYVADKIGAKLRHRVVSPDLLKGDPFDSEDKNRPLPVWLEDHPPEEGAQAVKPVIEALKRDGVSAIGVAGFCWGGKTVTGLPKSKHIKVLELVHPAYVTKDDIRGVKTPIAILGGQNDTLTPPDVIKQFEQVLNDKKVENYVDIFPNVGHGWTLRYDPNDPVAVKAANKAHQIMIDWFAKHL